MATFGDLPIQSMPVDATSGVTYPLIQPGSYRIAGTQQAGGRVIPTWGQLFPRGDNQF